MADSFKFELVSPERLLISEDAEQVILPGTEGEMTVMANHAPVMTTVKPGIVTVKPASGAEQRYAVFGGFADILPESCTLLAESAVHVDDLDREDLRRRIDEARQEAEQTEDPEARSRAELFLDQLTTLENAFIPA
jgi:F-type H+-transporting ATPase subunit epsilon